MQPGVTLCLRLRSGATLETLRAIGSDIERAEELAGFAPGNQAHGLPLSLKTRCADGLEREGLGRL